MVWKHVQPSGSMEGCVSEYGVYDQIGNAWEWVDLEQTASREQWIKYLEDKGHSVEVSQTLIQVNEGLLAKLQYNAVCVDMKRVMLDQELLAVELRKPISKDCLTAGQGYLWYQTNDIRNGEKPPEPCSLLPVKLWGNRIVWDKSRDGESVGAKVGGSFLLWRRIDTQFILGGSHTQFRRIDWFSVCAEIRLKGKNWFGVSQRYPSCSHAAWLGARLVCDHSSSISGATSCSIFICSDVPV